MKYTVRFAFVAAMLLVCAGSAFAELDADRRKQIIAEANRAEWEHVPYKNGGDYEPGKDVKVGLDCSHFVHSVYHTAVTDLPYLNSEAVSKSSLFTKVNEPEDGDLIYFPAYTESVNDKEVKHAAHIGIVVDAKKMKFIGQQTSTGVAQASYHKRSYWGKRTYKFYKLK